MVTESERGQQDWLCYAHLWGHQVTAQHIFPIACPPLPHSTATVRLCPKGNAQKDGNPLGMAILSGEEIKGLFCFLSISILLFVINIGYHCADP